METLQDLLDPSKDNISIVEDPKSGDVSLPGASLVEIRDQHSFVELLKFGEAHRFAANTKLNTESSRSHAILMVFQCVKFYFYNHYIEIVNTLKLRNIYTYIML